VTFLEVLSVFTLLILLTLSIKLSDGKRVADMQSHNELFLPQLLYMNVPQEPHISHTHYRFKWETRNHSWGILWFTH